MNGVTIQGLNPESLTWEIAWRFFALRCKALNLSAGTCKNYQQTYTLLLRHISNNGNPRPAEITIHHLRACLEAWKASGRASETLFNRFRNLRTFFGFLHKDGLITANPTAALERPRVDRRLIKAFTPEQFAATLAQIGAEPLGLRDKAILLLLADTGLRISEALNLRIGDLDLSNNTAVVMGKGRKERRICWGETVRRALLTWLRLRIDAKDGDFVFVNHFGATLVPEVFAQRVKKYTRKAGIAANRLSCHALRHFFAVQFLKSGGDLVTLSRLLGHTTLEMTRKYLNFADDEVLAKARQGGSVLDRIEGLPGGIKRVRLHTPRPQGGLP